MSNLSLCLNDFKPVYLVLLQSQGCVFYSSIYGDSSLFAQIEESILESLAWKSDSPLWETIKSSETIPLSAEVMYIVLGLCFRVFIRKLS